MTKWLDRLFPASSRPGSGIRTPDPEDGIPEEWEEEGYEDEDDWLDETLLEEEEEENG